MDETEISLHGGDSLTAEYRPAEVGPGTLILRTTDAVTGDSRQLSLLLDRLTPSGFWIEDWAQGEAIVICGAAGIVVIESRSLTISAVVPFEYEECETLEHPWFVIGEGALLVATESRVFRFDARPALRWCWTARVYSNEWFALMGPPRIENDVVCIALRSVARDAEVRIGLDDALALARP